MKKLIVFVILALLVSCIAPRIISLNQPYVKIYDDLNGTKDELFISANKWMVGIFNNAESVIQYFDKEEGVIIGKYLITGQLTFGDDDIYTGTKVFSQLDIRVKNGKARFEVDLEPWKYDPTETTVYDLTKEEVTKYLETLSESLHTELLKAKIDF